MLVSALLTIGLVQFGNIAMAPAHVDGASIQHAAPVAAEWHNHGEGAHAHMGEGAAEHDRDLRHHHQHDTTTHIHFMPPFVMVADGMATPFLTVAKVLHQFPLSEGVTPRPVAPPLRPPRFH